MSKTTWYKLIKDEMKSNNEDDNVRYISTFSNHAELIEEFDDGFGGTEGKPFTLWTENFVYFPLCYDGAEWCGSIARNPNDLPTEHQGGG